MQETQFKLKIKMDSETVSTLKKAGFQLYGFKAAQVSAKGQPQIWFTTDTYDAETDLIWT